MLALIRLYLNEKKCYLLRGKYILIKTKFLLLLVLLVGAQFTFGSLIYEDALDGSQSDNWSTTKGKWDFSSDGLANSKKGENRIFTDVAVGSDPYTIDFTGNLLSGNGWGLFFGSDLTSNNNKVTGMNFQYDPGYSGGAYLLRKWENDKESVVARFVTKLDYNTDHVFTLNVSSDSFSAFQDGVEVLSYTGDMNLAGSMIGMRTWSSSNAQFKNLTVSDLSAGKSAIPEPMTAVLAAAGSLIIFRKRSV